MNRIEIGSVTSEGEASASEAAAQSIKIIIYGGK